MSVMKGFREKGVGLALFCPHIVLRSSALMLHPMLTRTTSSQVRMVRTLYTRRCCLLCDSRLAKGFTVLVSVSVALGLLLFRASMKCNLNGAIDSQT